MIVSFSTLAVPTYEILVGWLCGYTQKKGERYSQGMSWATEVSSGRSPEQLYPTFVTCDVLGSLSVGGVISGRRHASEAALLASSARCSRLRVDGHLTVATLAVTDSLSVDDDPDRSRASDGARWSVEHVDTGLDVKILEISRSLVEVRLTGEVATTKWEASLRAPRAVAFALPSCSDGRLRLSYSLQGSLLRLQLESGRRRLLDDVGVSVLVVFGDRLVGSEDV